LSSKPAWATYSKNISKPKPKQNVFSRDKELSCFSGETEITWFLKLFVEIEF
jgi:hypothetical protein